MKYMKALFKKLKEEEMVKKISVFLLILLVPMSAFTGGRQEAEKEMYTLQMVYWPGPESEAMQEVINHFNENRAEEAGFKVELVLFGRDQFMSKQEAIMAAGSDKIDTFFISSRQLGKYVKFLEPLDEYLKDPEINIYGSSVNFFMKAAIEGLTWYDGSLLGVPRDISAHFLYYRQDYIDELLSNPGWQARYREISLAQIGKEMNPLPPEEWTWDDYLAASYFFTRKYNPDSPTKFGNYTQGKPIGPSGFLWTNAYWGYGGAWFTAEGAPNFNNEAAIKAAELFKKSWDDDLTPSSSIVGEYPECNEALRSGEVALAVHWNAAFFSLDAEDSPVSGKFGITVPPEGPAGRFDYNHTLAVQINTNSSHKKEAARFFTYLCTEEANDIYAKAGGIPPAESILVGMSDTRPDFTKMAENVSKYGRSLTPNAGLYEVMLIENLSNAWAGAISVENALKQLQKDAMAEMKKRQ